MRKESELLELLRDFILKNLKGNEMVDSGMCIASERMVYDKIITWDESHFLRKLITEMKPKKTDVFHYPWIHMLGPRRAYYYPLHRLKPRLRLLNKAIEHYKWKEECTLTLIQL